MVSFSVASMFFHEYTTPEIFSFVAQSGLDGIEFWLETPHFWLRDIPVGEVIAARQAAPGTYGPDRACPDPRPQSLLHQPGGGGGIGGVCGPVPGDRQTTWSRVSSPSIPGGGRQSAPRAMPTLRGSITISTCPTGGGDPEFRSGFAWRTWSRSSTRCSAPPDGCGRFSMKSRGSPSRLMCRMPLQNPRMSRCGISNSAMTAW